MPKHKSHRGAKKRFRTTGSGRLVRRQRGLNHFLGKKTSRHKRRLTGPAEVAPADESRVRRLLND
jgi:large subunit ribosomal protein L35